MHYATMCSEPVTEMEQVPFEPIPMVLEKANENLDEALQDMKRVYRLIFGDDVTPKEMPKREKMTQSAEAIAIRAKEIRQAVQALAERLGA